MGPPAAARLRRLSESMEIIVLERSGYVSFANCGLPYHLSATIADRGDLLLQTPESLRERFRLDVRVRNEVTAINRNERTLVVRDLATGVDYELHYDALVLSPVPPDRSADPRRRTRVGSSGHRRSRPNGQRSAQSAKCRGCWWGFIGLEAAENLKEAGLDVTLVELGDQLLAPLDPEMAKPLERELRRHGVAVELGHSVAEIEVGTATLDDGRVIAADLVVFAIGVRPDGRLAADAGLRLGPTGESQSTTNNEQTTQRFGLSETQSKRSTCLMEMRR